MRAVSFSRGAVASRLQRRLLCTLPQRIAALSKLQDREDELTVAASEKVLALQRALHAQADAIRSRRADILAGSELTEDEKELAPVELDHELFDEQLPVTLGEANVIEGYWRAVIVEEFLRSDGETGAWLNERDQQILEHLLNIRIEIEDVDADVKYVEEVETDVPTQLHKVTLTFSFKANDFMDQTELSVNFLRDALNSLISTEGCVIPWTDGSDPTVKHDEGEELVAVPSFFHLFSSADFLDESAMDSSTMLDEDEEKLFVMMDRNDVTSRAVQVLETAVVPNATELLLNPSGPDDDMDYSDEYGPYDSDGYGPSVDYYDDEPQVGRGDGKGGFDRGGGGGKGKGKGGLVAHGDEYEYYDELDAGTASP